MEQVLLKQEINQLQVQLTQKITHTETGKEKAIYEMYDALLNECMLDIMQLEALERDVALKGSIMKYKSIFQQLIGELTILLQDLMQVPYPVLIKKKVYEEIDELIADIEDCIENINEALEGKGNLFHYMEAWNIGVFFENDYT